MEKTGFHEDFINGAGKTVTAEIFFYMESEPSDKQILYLSKGSEEILIFHRNILADEPVPHHAAGRKRDRKSTRLNSSHWNKSRMPSSA